MKDSHQIKESGKVEEGPKNDFSGEKQRFIEKTSKITAIDHANGHFFEDLKISRRTQSEVLLLGK